MRNKQSAWCIFSILILVALFGVVGAIPNARASEQRRSDGTDVSGPISTNTVWTASGSPYNLVGNIDVLAGVTLTLLPGTVVNGNGLRVNVTGTFVVSGSTTSRVKLNNLAVQGPNTTATSPCLIDINFAEVTKGRIHSFPSSDYCIIRIRDSTLINIDVAEPIWLWNLSEDAYIERNTFYRSTGIIVSDRTFATFIRNNVFIEQGTFYGQVFAIKSDGTPADKLLVENNSFLSSDRIVLALGQGINGNWGMTAINNYWGGASETEINLAIYDHIDDPNYVANTISYLPRLTAPHSSTPIANFPSPTPTSTSTSTSTSTWTPTATSTATSTPTATPIPLTRCPSGKVSVLPNYTSYAPNGQFHILVEFCNGTDKPITKPEAVVRFLDGAGSVIETKTGPNFPSFESNYAPGARWCGIFLLNVAPVGMASFVIDAPTYQVSGHSQAPLSFLDVVVNITDRTILGRIRNDHIASISGLEYRASIYDGKGGLIGCDGFRLNTSDLGVGQSTSFNAIFPNYGSITDPLYADYAGYHIWADALELGKVPIFLPQTVRQIAPTATRTPVPFLTTTATPVQTPGPPSLMGSRNILKVNANPVISGSTIYATWNIPNFQDGEFDRGDGAGFKGPIALTMTVDIPNVTTSRYIILRWHDTSGQQLDDTLLLQVVGP